MLKIIVKYLKSKPKLVKVIGFFSLFRIITKNLILFLVKKGKAPPVFIPFRWFSRYTLGRRIKVNFLYLNDLYPCDKPIIYTKKQIDSNIEKVKNNEIFSYGKTVSWLYQALNEFSINDKNVAIMGSTLPVYESICLFYGGKPTTIEYNKIISEDSRLKVIMVDEYKNNPVKFDSAFSISSFEHDGLGRYGDNLNPEGDFAAMRGMREIIKPGCFLFLSIPIGIDSLVWNAHRIYGKIRLPLLLKGWDVVKAFGFEDSLFNKFSYYECTQPVFVLRNGS